MIPQNPGDNLPQNPPEQEPCTYTWQEVQATISAGGNLDLTPGTLIVDIPPEKYGEECAFERFDQAVYRQLLRGQDKRRIGMRGLMPGIGPHMARPKNFIGALEGRRMLIMPPDLVEFARIDRALPQGPACSVAYMADMRSSGRGFVGTITAIRTYAVSAQAGHSTELPLDVAPLTVHSRTRRLNDQAWQAILAQAQALGHQATALGIQGAFHGGLPGLGKRR